MDGVSAASTPTGVGSSSGEGDNDDNDDAEADDVESAKRDASLRIEWTAAA